MRIVLIIVVSYLLLLMPEPAPPTLADPYGTPFAWNHDKWWMELGHRVERFRTVAPDSLAQLARAGFHRGFALIDSINSGELQPDDRIFNEMEGVLLDLGQAIIANRDMMWDYTRFMTLASAAVKRQSQKWDWHLRKTKERIYRLLYGSNAVLEEAIVQNPVISQPVLIKGEDEHSHTPSANVLGISLHSGDILISRGRSAVSAFIARANDFPGLYSHAALVYVDSESNRVTIIESDGNERGVMLTTAEEYVKDSKSRLMVLRLRSDIPELVRDPLLPHEAATYMLKEARGRTIPFDFDMNGLDHSKMYCSEVPAAAYEKFGINLWMTLSSVSAPGVVSWFSALGIGSLSLQEPSDLEYNPQLAIVAQWKDPGALFMDQVSTAVTDVMLGGAEEGDKLAYEPLMLPYARVAKLYSMLVYHFGGSGYIPQGMTPGSALSARAYIDAHSWLSSRVVAMAQEFEISEGYTPSQWRLLNMAKQAKAERH